MTPEEKINREQDGHVKFLKEHICDKRADAPFVFISYKSDDWNVVLHDIVYSLVKDYGLNVYFDGSFDSHNALWLTQFPENMEHHNCKGVLSFLDNKYATSYATVLELMYSQTFAANIKGGLPVVPINLDKLRKIDGAQGAVNTGLGVSVYEDGTKNVNAKTEQTLFDNTFKELTERNILIISKYIYKEDINKKKKTLDKKSCMEIATEILAYLKINENYYEKGKTLEGIVGSIRDACGDDVFKDVSSHRETSPNKEIENRESNEVVVVNNPKGGERTRKSSVTYDFVLYDKNYENMILKNLMLTVFEEVMNRHTDKTNRLLASLKCLAKGHVISKDASPTTFRAGKNVMIGGREISIGTSLNSSSVLNYIDKLINICCEPAEIFQISVNKESEDGNDNARDVAEQDDIKYMVTEPVTLEVKTSSGVRRASGTYDFVLYGVRYEDIILKNLMLTVFEEVMNRHADKTDQLLISIKCLAEGKVISKDASPAVFHAGKVISIGEKEISIGTSLDRFSVLRYIRKLMEICEESKDTLVIDGYEY